MCSGFEKYVIDWPHEQCRNSGSEGCHLCQQLFGIPFLFHALIKWNCKPKPSYKPHIRVGSLSWCLPLPSSSLAALPAMTCDEKMAWNSTEPWRAGDVESQSRDKGNFSSALRVQCPRGVICVSFAPFPCDPTWRINTAAWWGRLLLCQWYPDLYHPLSEQKFIPEQWCCQVGAAGWDLAYHKLQTQGGPTGCLCHFITLQSL